MRAPSWHRRTGTAWVISGFAVLTKPAARSASSDTVRRMPPERVHLDGGAARGVARERIDSTWRDRT